MGLQTTVTITVRGNKELEQKLKRISKNARSQLTAKAVRAGADFVKGSVQEEILAQGLYESGALYKGVLVSSGRGRLRSFLYEVSMQVRGNYDWVHEYGATLTPKKAKLMVFEIGDELIFAKKVKIPARPYFRPGVSKSRAGARKLMADKFVDLVLAREVRRR